MSSEIRPFETLDVKHSHRWYQLLSLIWLWLSFTFSVWYLYLLAPSFANDLWWPNYNASGSQAFLIDTINYLIKVNQNMGNVDITSVLNDHDYGNEVTYPNIYPIEGAAILTNQLTSLSHAIPAIRNMSTKYNLWIPTLYCWVDFSKQWEVATTDQRQQRCYTKFKHNAAMYLEGVLRNTQWSKFIASFGGPGNLFTIGIQLALEETSAGQIWLNTTSSCNTTLEQELIYWESFNVSIFQIQWQNAILSGIDENIMLINAFGIEKPVQIHTTAKVAGPWTSVIFNVFFSNDLLFITEVCNASLVRQSSKYFSDIGCYQPPTFEVLMGLYDTSGNYVNQTGLIRDRIGPYLSVDMWIPDVPAELVKMVSLFDKSLTSNLSNSDTLKHNYKSLPTYTFSPMPPSWNGDYYYYGGNPMCLSGSAQIFPQQTFATTDACNAPIPFNITPTKRSLLFGLSMTNYSIKTICNSDMSPLICLSILSQALESQISIDTHDVENVTNTINHLNITLMQFATNYNQTNWTLLLQPLLLHEWDFYGWTMLYDWVIGTREVVAFEGDNGTLVLISDMYPTTSNSPSVDTMTHSSYLIFYLVVYFSMILGLLAFASTVAAMSCRFKFDAINLIFLNRVGGSTWLGRPLMFLRGCTAILLLSTAPLVLTNYQGFTKFEPTRRSWIETLVLINEANWVTYVITEVLLIMNPKGIQVSGCLSCGVVWLIYLCIDVIAPISATTQLSRTCSAQDFYLQLHCSGSIVSIGDYSRACLLLVVPVIVVAVITLCVSVLKISHKDSQAPYYPGVAEAFFLSCGRDPLANLLAGLVPWTKHRVFNFNLWLITSSSITSPKIAQLPPGELIVSRWHTWNQRMWNIAGTIYIVAAIYSSVSYFNIAQVNWANDLIWPGFNMTGTHQFLANWFIRNIMSAAPAGSYRLDQPSLNSLGNYNMSSAVLIPSHYFGFRVQYTNLTNLVDVIYGLRQSDACMAPWIFTQYCYVDFQQRWEMANSHKRQARCTLMTHNGAIFLESLLRNIHWDDWMHCWGDAFQIAVANELRQTVNGQHFLHLLSSDKLDVINEASYWNQFGIVI
ncbi:hypothetical protein THRCLA_11159 [Thraustotheca clavata]|uniref:Transmembrane protein n=1 Tax=Thraustotheca clavata TaxID=74557 RepID=A0A1V9Y8L4_9STRA|nr:hypothetical protein THRCLA_11159 [Thraustotheca clavata]